MPTRVPHVGEGVQVLIGRQLPVRNRRRWGRCGCRVCQRRCRHRWPPPGPPVAARRTAIRRWRRWWSCRCRPCPAHRSCSGRAAASGLGLQLCLAPLVGRLPEVDQPEAAGEHGAAPAARGRIFAGGHQLTAADLIGLRPIPRAGRGSSAPRCSGRRPPYLAQARRRATATGAPHRAEQERPTAAARVGRRGAPGPGRRPFAWGYPALDGVA